MAANLNYNVNINTSNGVQALNNLQNKLGAVNRSFEGLKNAIAGIAIGSVVSNLLRFADGIQDLSEATGIATSTLLGFQKAVQAAGGSADGADKAVLRLVQNIGEAAGGSAELQLAFAKVGVTLKDLATLSEQDILKKVIAGLGTVTDKSEQAALKAQLLGKEFRGVATSGLAEALDANAKASEKYAQSIQRAAELQDNLDKAIGRVKLTLLEILDPIAQFINSMDQGRLQDFIENVTKLAAALVALSALGRATAALQALQVAMGGVLATVTGLIVNVLKFGTIIGRILTGVGAAAVALAAIFPETAAKINQAFSEATDAVKEFLGIKPEDVSGQYNKNTEAATANAAATTASGEAARKVVDPFKNLREQLSGVADAYAKVNQRNLENIQQSTDLIGLSSQEAEIRKAQTDISRRAADEIDKLIERKAKLTEAEKNAGIGAIIDQQIAKIKEQADADNQATEQAIKNAEARKNAYALEQFARRSQIDVEKQIRDVQDQIATSTMGAMAKKEYEILAAARERALAEIHAEEVRRGSLMTDEEKQKYMDAALSKSRQLIDQHKKLYDQSRTFEAGWSKAFREYVDDATNAAKRAESIFRKVTDGMEDLIVNFVKTGKFEWKNFVASIAEDLLRSNLKQIIAGIFGGAGTGGLSGLLGGLGSLFGGGGGGGQGQGSSASNPLYVVDIAGGGGMGGGMGDIFGGGQTPGGGIGGALGGIFGGIKDAASGIWDGIKSVGGSIIDGIGSAVSGIGSAIGGLFGGGGGGDSGGSFLGDIASGIGDLFGGWFANGGTLGAGKWGIAGEAGPEMISGPANVTPLGTNVTYNINAVDAASFKQMIAADPSFIHGVAMMGAKGMPSRR